MGYSIKTLAKATNLSEEAIAAAIALRQQQLIQQQQVAATSTTTTTKRPTASPVRKYPLATPSKVMNAPREYYPVGYDKNFDDNFASRVELPDTTFSCGDQKHFPGLYADEDLGCMVSRQNVISLTNVVVIPTKKVQFGTQLCDNRRWGKCRRNYWRSQNF